METLMEYEKVKSRKRLSMNIPPLLHKEIETMAVRRNCSITTWVLQALLEKLRIEKQYE